VGVGRVAFILSAFLVFATMSIFAMIVIYQKGRFFVCLNKGKHSCKFIYRRRTMVQIYKEDMMSNTQKLKTAAEWQQKNSRNDESLSFKKTNSMDLNKDRNSLQVKLVATEDGKVWLLLGNNAAPILLNQVALSLDQIDMINEIPTLRRDKILNGRKIVYTEIDDNAIRVKHIKDKSVTTNKIVDAAITQSKIADSSVTQLKIANNAVTTNQVVDGAITQSKLANNAVNEARIQNGAVTLAKLANGAIITQRIGNEAGGRINLLNGLILHWGWSSDQNNTFPTTFPNSCLAVFFAGYRDANNNAAWGSDISPENVTRTGFRWKRQSGTSAMNRRRWFALGH